MSLSIRMAAAGLSAALLCATTAVAGPGDLSFRLSRPAVTSAGVYDATGHLVKTLWTMRSSPAGPQSQRWDGMDSQGNPAGPGSYHFEVVANRSVYKNVGVIGNSGRPRNAAGHTPANMESVAVDSDGAIYTANGWDEAGADFKKWDSAGRSVYGANFQIRNGQPNGAPYSVATDDEYLYCGMGGWNRAPWNSKQQIQRFRLSDGEAAPFPTPGLPNGHIQLYEWPEK